MFQIPVAVREALSHGSVVLRTNRWTAHASLARRPWAPPRISPGPRRARSSIASSATTWKRPHRRRGPSPFRRARVPAVPDLRRARPRLRARAVRRLRLRAPRALLVQTTRLLSELWRPPHGGAGGTLGRSRPPARPGAPVGAQPAPPRALPPRLEPQALPRGPRRRRPRSARFLSAPGPPCGRARWPERRGDGDPALRGRPSIERRFPPPP